MQIFRKAQAIQSGIGGDAMTVVAFTTRFTPDDLSAFDAIAWRHITTGVWSHVSRQTHADSDQVLVYLPLLDRPVFRFERDRSGIYRLWFHGGSGPQIVATGTTAAECLSIWSDIRKGAAS
jgi:hypothetical protein